MNYTALEADRNPFSLTKDITQTSDAFSFIFTLGIAVCIIAAFIILLRAAFYRMTATGAGDIQKSTTLATRAVLGIGGILLIFPILAELNPMLLGSKISFSIVDLKLGDSGATRTTSTTVTGDSTTNTTPVTTSSPAGGVTGGAVGPRVCRDLVYTEAQFKSGANFCATATCKVLTGCPWRNYESIIKEAGAEIGVDWRVIVAFMCRESTANPGAINSSLNANGSADCGLMQINSRNGSCSGLLDPRYNIYEGARKIKEKYRLVNAFTYSTAISPLAKVAAGYNCCGNGDNPNSNSVSCKNLSVPVPKWACPIDPGAGTFNMCAVQDYACEIDACVRTLQ